MANIGTTKKTASTKGASKKRTGRPPNDKKICMSCGRELARNSNFYASKSPMFAADGRINICRDCFIKECVDGKTNTLDIDKFKLLLMRTDYPFYMDVLKSAEDEVLRNINELDKTKIKNHGTEVVRKYMKDVCSLRQLMNRRYADSEADNFLFNSSTSIKDQEDAIKILSGDAGKKPEDVKWSRTDKQNKKYVLSMVGYDPFIDLGLNEEDMKYCYNILAGYCDTDGIVEDGHKMQSVIEITMLYCQCRKITENINAELSRTFVDDAKVQKLTSSKSSMLSSIATIAKDNNISSNYNKNSRQGQNSLSSKMKEMEQNGFADADVNMFDIKTSEAFRQIDEISNSNIEKQLTLDSNEYTDIIKEQREMIGEYTDKIDELQEENRQLRNEVLALQSKNKKGGAGRVA